MPKQTEKVMDNENKHKQQPHKPVLEVERE